MGGGYGVKVFNQLSKFWHDGYPAAPPILGGKH